MQILIADDDRTERKVLSAYTRGMGYDPLTAEDGLEAFNLWLKHRPRIILTDWNMPLMDGIELCMKIRNSELEDYTYIIMVTARENSDDLIQGYDSGVDDYITKPVNKAELAVRLKSSERIFNLLDKDLVIFSMAKLAETRNLETGLHLERIQCYCRIISEFLLRESLFTDLINRRFIDDIFSTSPLHDIGKVGIPDRILLKPGRLNENEYETIKSHAIIGYETLQSAINRNPKANYLKMSAQIARSHHERWDGTGYPDGLKEEEIPIAARIVAVADVYDALASKRVYKQAFTHKRAKEIILEGRKTMFDPVITDVFAECEDEFKKIMTKFMES